MIVRMRNVFSRLMNRILKGGLEFNNCAVLAREWKDLDLLRSIFEAKNIPVNLHWGRGGGFPGLGRIRENAVLLEYLKKHRVERITGRTIKLQG